MTQKRYVDDELLSLSGIQHFYFCKRQWALIHVEQQWKDNLRTTEGHFLHERVDDPFFTECRGDVRISRAFPLVSYSLGLYGIADVIEYVRSETGVEIPEYEGRWSMHPVEYKRGKPKVDERDEVQLCAQVMCLEEMFGVKIPTADFYYYEIRRRVHVNITNELRDLVSTLSKEMHRLYREGITPPAEKNKKCSLCSLNDICMPKLTKKKKSVDAYVRKHVTAASETRIAEL